MTGRDPMDYGWWLASRASGLVALALITLSVTLGLAMAGRVSREPRLRRALLSIHEHAALGGLIAIAVHGITLLGDRWLHPGPVGIAVPFAMEHEPLWTGLGIIAGYLAAALGLSFYARRRIGAKRWRSLHKATILVYVAGRRAHARRGQRRRDAVAARAARDHRRAGAVPARDARAAGREGQRRRERRTTGISAVPGAS